MTNLRLVRLGAKEQAGLFNGARRLPHLAVGEVPLMRSRDPGACQAMPPRADALTKNVRDVLDAAAHGGQATATRAGDRSSGRATGD